MTKARGGRGLLAENKYKTFSATLSPDLLAQLDVYSAARGVSRSEMLSIMITRHFKMWPLKTKKNHDSGDI